MRTQEDCIDPEEGEEAEEARLQVFCFQEWLFIQDLWWVTANTSIHTVAELFFEFSGCINRISSYNWG